MAAVGALGAEQTLHAVERDIGEQGRDDAALRRAHRRRVQRAELGQYASEMAWREDNRRQPNGTLYLNAAGAALGHPVSRQWAGYWQR